MNPLDEQYGYDANFISDVWESLKCNVCHLVMRQPVQIMTCGHRFCKPCFERNTQLRCPIDRDQIDVDKVFDDTAVARDISNLQVSCSYVVSGCSWKGDLRNLMDHEKECQHQINQNMQKQNQVPNTEIVNLVAELSKRVQSCENTLNGKEKDLAHIKYDIDEMKRKYGEKENEATALKTLNGDILREMSEIKKINEKLKEYFKREVETLKKRNEKFETRLNLLETSEYLEKFEGQSKSLELQINANEKTVLESKDTKNQLENYKADISSKIELLETQIKANATNTKEVKDKAATKRQLENFKTKITNKVREKEISKQPRILLDPENNPTEEALKNIGDDFSELKTRIEKRLELIEKLFTTFRDGTIYHLANIENVMFCHEPYCKERNVKIKWVMTNFQRYYYSGKVVVSPIFYTSLQGYCFKLVVKWTGDDREDLCLGLWVCRNENIPVELKKARKPILDPFRIEYDIEIHHKDRGSIVGSATFDNLDDEIKTALPSYLTTMKREMCVDGQQCSTSLTGTITSLTI